MKSRGFTLLELMISVAILSVVLVLLFGLANSLAQGSRAQEAKMAAVDDARSAMMLMTRDIRQAGMGSVSWGALPGPTLTYRIATDLDGNGYAVDLGGYLELSAPRLLTRDTTDLNGDGMTETQLVLIMANGTARVLANGLLPDEDINSNGTLDAGEDGNGNGVLDRGLWFEPAGGGIQITVQASHEVDPQQRFQMISTLRETVVPRN